MSYPPSGSTALSAPGKVLLTGGYLVLDRNYTGTVIALDARIHVIVQQLRRGHRRGASFSSVKGGFDTETVEDGSAVDDKDKEDVVVVRSPQFVNAVWEYGIQRCENGGGIKVIQKNEGRTNPFVETSLNYALTYISYVADSKDFGSLSVTILADTDYYSETAFSRASESPGRFVNFGVPLHEAHKTGLGSSAALVTALVSSLVIHRTLQPDDLGAARDKLHNLAQAAHCAAQGKVGSGFDVAAAIYGSCLYRRFSPSILESVGDAGSPGFEERLFAVVEDADPKNPWDTECLDFGMRLPRGMQMVLCDVECGSNSPSMVKKVLEWRKQNQQEADLLWAALQSNNERLCLQLKQLAQSPDQESLEDFNDVRNLIQRSRNHLRSMTRKAGVPIEPRVQTELLDAVSAIDGVIGGVVPGAGGYDAIAVLIRDDQEVLRKLNELFENWESKVEDDFGGKIGTVRLLGVRHGSDGVKNELLDQYAGWL
ncbi:phosphomevalonate kinase [Aspergillus nomiae NRRL 13137]|uniref:Phosphomevalonate kinase n=1 Tax=Aspergillus nomiae NRRL (strain ATCC 15546 / NRRL 13137 / CBS 260.88 / M93) TaxID=1509407 RepID=A0A0L1IP74_ASPN3|nr:phosphomevalonate kinase [Aspergillus nomiae NRRL 13137]KNG81013.1 phosphomevalonate kinase [Aspergillus nomiae NRRL 13137]